MNLKVRSLACLIAGTVAIGCGGSGTIRGDASLTDGPASNPDAKDGAPANATDAPLSDATDATATDTTATDTTDAPMTDTTDAPVTDAPTTADAATEATPSDATPADDTSDGGFMPGVGSKLVVSGGIQLIGSGHDTCTNQVPATGDRWCGFAKPSATLGAFELWVVNVTKVAANVPVTCDTTDANCLRLSRALYSDATTGFRGDGFDGDTLTYSELPTTSANGFVGAISAWRPGWSGGRVLTSNTGVACNGHRASHAEICFENLVSTGTGVTTAELHAGILDSQSGGPLPFVDTILVTGATDAVGVQKWEASITPDGAKVAWSTRVAASGTENLDVQTIGDNTSRVAVASDVSQWIVTSDATAWLWLGAYNYDLNGTPSGTLQSAAFPSGTAVQTLGASVGDFKEAGTKGVLYRSAVSATGGKLMLAPDRDAPAVVTMLDQGVASVFEVTTDGTRATYTKNIQSIGSNIILFDLWLSGAAGAAPCALTSTATGFLPPSFLSGGDMAAWGRFNSLTGEVQGVYTKTSDCTTHAFASDLFSFAPVADEGYVFLDTLAPDPNVNEATLRYAKVANGALPPLGTPIQVRAGLAFATLLPSLPGVIYTVSTGGAGDGLYVNATLPFTATP
jgi:hypothetical protein